jgi:hypothetical protein
VNICRAVSRCRRCQRWCLDFDTGRYHRHPDDASKAFVEGRADDDVGVGVDLLADTGGGLVDLEKGEVPAPGDPIGSIDDWPVSSWPAKVLIGAIVFALGIAAGAAVAMWFVPPS